MCASLSAKGMLNLTNYENDFTFIVGQSTYQCPCFLAEFLSPRIASLRHNGRTVDIFHVNLHSEDDCSAFSSFLSLGFGHSLDISNSLSCVIGRICCELGNIELYESIFNTFEGEITTKNVIQRIRDLSKIGSHYEAEVDFAASHFYELIDIPELSELPHELLTQIVSNHSLTLHNENLLCNFVCQMISHDCANFPLFEFVHFEYLSVSSMRRFVECVSKSFESFTFPIWESLCRRLIQERSLLRFGFCSNGLDGSIHYLTTKCSGNVHDQGVVHISASTTGYGTVKTLVDFPNASEFHTANQPNSWVCYDFKEMKVIVSDYTIRARTCDVYHYPRNWILEGSCDGNTWTKLDLQENNETLQQIKQIATFKVTQWIHHQPMRMIRLRQTGINSSNHHHLCLSGLELFGYVLENEE
jgi:hypothetical protein